MAQQHRRRLHVILLCGSMRGVLLPFTAKHLPGDSLRNFTTAFVDCLWHQLAKPWNKLLAQISVPLRIRRNNVAPHGGAPSFLFHPLASAQTPSERCQRSVTNQYGTFTARCFAVGRGAHERRAGVPMATLSQSPRLTTSAQPFKPEELEQR